MFSNNTRRLSIVIYINVFHDISFVSIYIGQEKKTYYRNNDYLILLDYCETSHLYFAVKHSK